MNIMIQKFTRFSRETFVSKDAGLSSDEFLNTKEHPIIPDVGVEIITFGESEAEVFMAGLQGVYRTYDNGKHGLKQIQVL